MAISDVVSDIQNIAAGASLIFQPSGTNEFLITHVTSSFWIGTTPTQAPFVQVDLYDGILYATISRFGWNPKILNALQLLVNNTNRLRLLNRPTNAEDIGYCGMQVR